MARHLALLLSLLTLAACGNDHAKRDLAEGLAMKRMSLDLMSAKGETVELSVPADVVLIEPIPDSLKEPQDSPLFLDADGYHFIIIAYSTRERHDGQYNILTLSGAVREIPRQHLDRIIAYVKNRQ